jgi:hypothetical protein
MTPLFVLVHSPSVGPATWMPVAKRLTALGHTARVPVLTAVGDGGPPFWPSVVDGVLGHLADVPPEQPVVLVVHSNAGLFLPLIRRAVRQPVLACVFVDAAMPARGGQTAVAPDEGLRMLRGLVDSDGLLPQWTEWWDEADVAPMFPDPATRRLVSGEQPRLPLSYYEQSIPVPADWDDCPVVAYVVFGPPYDAQVEQARERGWAVFHLPGAHLHQIVEPDAVADLILSTALSAPLA